MPAVLDEAETVCICMRLCVSKLYEKEYKTTKKTTSVCVWQRRCAVDRPEMQDKSSERMGLIHRRPSLWERTCSLTGRTHRHETPRTPSLAHWSQLYHCSSRQCHVAIFLRASPCALRISLFCCPPQSCHFHQCTAAPSDLNRGKITVGCSLSWRNVLFAFNHRCRLPIRAESACAPLHLLALQVSIIEITKFTHHS